MLLTTAVFQYRTRSRLSREAGPESLSLAGTGSSTIKDMVCMKRPSWKQEVEFLAEEQSVHQTLEEALEKEVAAGMAVTVTLCTSALLWRCHRF